jgi:ribosome recycling factor
MAAYDKTDLERRMAGAVEALKSDLAGLRTGRASTALLDPVMVTVYGSSMPLNQVATVSAPEPRMTSARPTRRSAPRGSASIRSSTARPCACRSPT